MPAISTGLAIGLGVAGLGASVAGSVLNRPKGLNSSQKQVLDQLTASLNQQANAPVTADPVQKAQLFNQIAQSGTGAVNRITNEFSARGLGRSGLVASELGRVSRTEEGAQSAAVADLLNQSLQRKTQAQDELRSLLLGIPSMQGQSAAGAGLSGLGQSLGFLLALNQLGKH